MHLLFIRFSLFLMSCDVMQPWLWDVWEGRCVCTALGHSASGANRINDVCFFYLSFTLYLSLSLSLSLSQRRTTQRRLQGTADILKDGVSQQSIGRSLCGCWRGVWDARCVGTVALQRDLWLGTNERHGLICVCDDISQGKNVSSNVFLLDWLYSYT